MTEETHEDIKRRHTTGAAGNGTVGAHRFAPVRFRDVHLNASPPYLVRNLIPREGLIVVWGPPKCGKSFWAFDLAMHVALGWPYRGRRTQRGTVVYIAAEGERGLAARAEAFRRRFLADDADPDFYLLTSRLSLVADAGELILDIAAAIGGTNCAAIIIDTLNRTIAGSENKDEDMSAFVAAADKLREAFTAAVIIIHHCGVNGERPRGHTSLTGACDAQLAVTRDSADHIVVEVEHLKDGPQGDAITSRLVPFDVGTDDDGEAISSCIVEAADDEPAVAKHKRLSDAAAIALDTLRKAIAEAGQDPPGSNHIPPSARVVDVETWRRYHYAGTASDGQTPETRKKAFQRVRQQLQASHVIGFHTDLCWIASDG